MIVTYFKTLVFGSESVKSYNDTHKIFADQIYRLWLPQLGGSLSLLTKTYI